MENISSKPNFLIEVTPVKPDGSIKTIWMSRAGGSSAGVYLDNKEWKPLLETLPTFSLNLMSSGQLQTVAISYGDLEFICSDAYGNEEWSSYDWTNALATCWYGYDGQQFSQYQQVFAGRVSGFNRSGIFATVALLGSEADLQRPALYEEYAGTGGIEGGAGLRGNIKPRAHGYCRNVTPVQIDTVNVVYQVHGYGPIQGIPAVYDFAQALAPSSANVSTYQELINLDLQPGQWATCHAHGLFRLGGTTDKKLTCDVQGALYNGTYTNTVQGIAQHLIREVQPSATFGAWGAFTDAEWCFYATDAQSVSDIVNRAVYEAGGYLLPDGLGRWQVGDFYAPVNKGQLRSDRSALPLVIDHEETTSTGPVWKVSVGHSRCWTTHTTAEISPSIIDLEGYVTDEALDEALEDFNETKAEVETQLRRLDAMVADGVLDRAEKKYWVQQYAVETGDWNKLNSDAAQWAVSSQLNHFNVRFNDLTAYLNSLSPAWNDGSQDTPIDRAAYRAAWEGLYSAKIALTQAMAESAKWEKISGAGKPQDNATVGAPVGTPVGNKPAEDVIDAITDANGNIIKSEKLQTDIAAADVIARDLQQTYGTTVTAAASANAAAQHEQNAQTAANNAAQAKADAHAIRNDAAQKANNSEASRLASEAAKTASELARDQAQYHSGQAGGSANAAAGHAGTATGKANEASQSAAAALASSVAASSTAQSMMPATFGDIKNWSGDWVNALGALSDDSRFNAYDHGTYGRILDVYNAPHFSPHIVPKGRIALVRDKVYRITVKWTLTGNQLGSPINATIFAVGVKPNSSQTGDFFNNIAINCQIAENQIGWGSFWATHTLDVHTNTLIDAGCQWTRPLFRIDSQGHYAVQSIEIRDITGEYRASGSADAAANSASSAAIDSGKAGNSASAASGSATNAKTSEDAAWQHRQAAAGHENTTGQYRSDAETFRNQASNSATNASGSAATALEQAGVATGAANRAGDSASAALRSEGSAASKADEAGRSASAAQQAEVSATTAAQAMMPADFQNIKNWTGDWGEGNYDLSQDTRYNAYDEPSLGRILRVTNNPTFSPHISSKGRVTLIRDHKYRITVKWHLVGQQPNENPVGGWIFFIGIRPNSGQTGDYWNNANSGVSIAVGQSGWGSGSWATHSIEVDANALLDAGCQWTRPLFRIDGQGVYDVQSIEFRDITGEANAKGSADAASGSANTASIKANEAGQSANAAEISKTSAKSSEDAAWQHRQGAAGHENTAGQYRSDAETFRNQASNSASNASNSAATATQQSGVAASSALDAASRATGNIVSRGEWNATSGKGTWTDAVDVAWAADIGQHVLSQTSRDSYDGEPVAGNWSNRRFRLSGEVQTWGSFDAQIGLHVVMNDGSNGWYIITVVNAGQWYTPFSTELLLPANVKAARGLLVSDGPHGDTRNGLNWRSVRIEDVTSEKAASDSASAAANSAQTATSKADEAGRSASAASSSEVRATSAADGADKTFANTFPNFVGPVGQKAYVYLGDNGTGFQFDYGPGAGWPQPYITAQGPGQGGRYNRITFKESIPRTVGRRYRVTGWFYNHGNNCTNVNIWLLQTDNNAWDGNAIGHGGDAVAPECVNNVALNQGGFWKVGIEFTVQSNYKSLWKPIFEFQTSGAAPNGLWHMTGMTIEDITSEKAAADSATAASNAYSNASIESGKAGQQAQAASGHANTAQIKSGEAQGYANSAQGSAATANDKASAAASSATLAATFSTGGGNLLPETSFAVNTTGWNFYSPFNNSQFVFGRDQSGDDWRPTNEHNIGINQANGDTSVWSQFHSDQVSVEGSKWYEFSGYVAAHRCKAHVRVDWLDANGNGISSNYSNANESAAQGGRDINAWMRCWGKVQAPSNAARAHVVFVKDPTLSGYGDSYAWMCRPMLRQTYAEANGPSPYAPGSNSLTASAQQASINTNQTAIATANSSLANLTTIVQSGSPNLLKNGGFSRGMADWGETHPGWQPHTSGGWGQVANRPGDWNGYYCYIESAKMPVFGGAAYTLAADSLYYLYSGSGHCYTEIVWFDGAGNNVGQHTGGLVGATHDYSVNGSNRLAHKLTASSPGNATQAVVRLVHYKSDNTSVNVIGWRQVKFEQGNVMTAYSNEASVTTIAETVTNVDGKANTALARAAMRLDVNGYMVGWETNNNGSYGNFKINTDALEIGRSTGGARTTFANGCWKVFDENGVLRGRFGNLSA